VVNNIPLYNQKNRISIFTPKKIPDPFKRAAENNRIWKVIDKIAELYGNINNPEMLQILIYSEKCGACIESLPIWNNLTAELKRVLPTYLSVALEFNKYTTFRNVKTNGEEFYRAFGEKKHASLPLVLQNFEIYKKKDSKNKYYPIIKKINGLIIIYEGLISPYSFLSKTFKIENDFIMRIYSNKQ